VPVNVDRGFILGGMGRGKKLRWKWKIYRAAIAWGLHQTRSARHHRTHDGLADILVGRSAIDEKKLQRIMDERTTPWV